MPVTDHDPTKRAGPKTAATYRRYLSPFERDRIHEAAIEAAGRELDKCVNQVRARILRGLHVRECGGFATIEALVDDPEAVAAALRDAGFEVTVHGLLVSARRRLKARTRGKSK